MSEKESRSFTSKNEQIERIQSIGSAVNVYSTLETFEEGESRVLFLIFRLLSRPDTLNILKTIASEIWQYPMETFRAILLCGMLVKKDGKMKVNR